MTTTSDQTPGTPVDVAALMHRVARLELENRLLERSLLVADHERQTAQDLAKHLLAARANMLKAIQGSGCGEVGKALTTTRKMLESIYATVPLVPRPEAETE